MSITMHYVSDTHYWTLDEPLKIATLRNSDKDSMYNRTVGGVRFICGNYFCFIFAYPTGKYGAKFEHEVDSLEAGMEWVVSQLVVQKLTN